jgi:epsin
MGETSTRETCYDADTDSSNDFYEIMDMLDKRLNDKGKNWRHVLKSLKVLDYCLHEGSELVVTWARKNIYIIKTLREFTYVEDDSHDVGQNGVLCDALWRLQLTWV